MAIEKSNPIKISDFHRGDKVVPKDAKLRLCGIWTVKERAQYLITAHCRVNGETKVDLFGSSDIICKIKINQQLLFYFKY
jgi:hypothetical protein